MKLSLNGALTIGSMDGANIEMSKEIGTENMFIFGMREEEITRVKEQGYNPADIYNKVDSIKRIINQLQGNELTDIPDEREVIHKILEPLVREDKYFILKDLISYKETQEKVSELYKNKIAWARKVVLNIARMGTFSSDRAIMQYNKDIWNLEMTSITN